MDVDVNGSGDSYKEGEDRMERKRPFRVTESTRTQKKGIVASSYGDIIQQCSQRFQMAISKLVLEDDGTEVDSMYFETLPDNCLVMILSDGQVWSQPSSSCSSSQPSSSSSSGQTGDHSNVNHRVMAMVEQIRKSESASSSRAANTNVTTTCGWQHFSYQLMKYIMVKNSKNQANLGPRSISISRTASEIEILEILTGIFFPRGKSVKGRLETMDVKIGSYKGTTIADIGATLRSKKPHFYLLTKEKIPEILSSTSSDSDDLPDPEMSLPVLTFRQSPTLSDWTQPSSQINLHTDRTQSSSQINLHTDRTQPSPQAYVTSQRSGTGMYSIQQTPEAQFVTLQPEVPNVTPQRPSSSTASASLATMWNETGTPEVCIQSRKCTICYDKDVTAFLVPCAHKFCMACCRRVQRCPLCRMEITNVGSLHTNNEN